MCPARTILIVDDHALVRAAFAIVLEGSAEWKVVGEAKDGLEAVAKARELAPDLVLLDITMPGMNGLEACARILEELPRTKIILLSMHSGSDVVRAAAKAGAMGYVLKDSAPEVLEEALRAVLQGKTFFSPAAAAMQEAELTCDVRDLSRREAQVLEQIADGYTTHQIAERLCISAKTVETHRTNLMKKLNIDNVAGLTRYAIRFGLAKP